MKHIAQNTVILRLALIENQTYIALLNVIGNTGTERVNIYFVCVYCDVSVEMYIFILMCTIFSYLHCQAVYGQC